MTGVWTLDFGPYTFDVAQELQSRDIQAWADDLYRKRLDERDQDRWTLTCLPGGPAIGLDRQIAKIVQTPQLIIVLYEDLSYRQIFLDGRELPKDPNPSWMGYSTGRWDGDTLIVESAGYNARTWLDYGGHPHTEALHITERYRRTDFGHIDLETTYNDPGAFNKSFAIHTKLTFAPGAELLESICAENEKDRSHITKKVSEETITLRPETLEKYAGIYELVPPGARVAVPVPVTLSAGQLILNFMGKLPLTPISETTFLIPQGAPVDFVLDERGKVTGIVIDTIEFQLRGRRRK